MKRRGEMSRWKRLGACSAAGICVVFLLSALALSGCRVVTGSGDLVTTTVDAAGFTKVKAYDSWDVKLVRGDSYSVSVTCDDDIEELLDVAVDGDTLLLRLKAGTGLSLTTRVTLKAIVVMPRLDGLELADSSEAAVSGFSSGSHLAVSLHDASSVVLNGVSAGTLDARAADACSISGSIQVDQTSLQLSDASDATLSGSARVLTLHASDGCAAHLRGLQTVNASVTLSDACGATIAVDGTLDAHVSDASDLRYLGSPKLSSDTSVNDDSSLGPVGQGQ